MTAQALVAKSPDATRYSAPYDEQILNALNVPRRPVDVAEEVGLSTHYVAGRLKALMHRGWVERIRPNGAPANGPRASLYLRVRTR